jgi:hypothetical protein
MVKGKARMDRHRDPYRDAVAARRVGRTMIGNLLIDKRPQVAWAARERGARRRTTGERSLDSGLPPYG